MTADGACHHFCKLMAPVRHRWSINDVIGGIRNTVTDVALAAGAFPADLELRSGVRSIPAWTDYLVGLFPRFFRPGSQMKTDHLAYISQRANWYHRNLIAELASGCDSRKHSYNLCLHTSHSLLCWKGDGDTCVRPTSLMKEVHRRISAVSANTARHVRVVVEWHKRFREGRVSLQDDALRAITPAIAEVDGLIRTLENAELYEAQGPVAYATFA
ncbi:hypothetical protein ANN_04750 [Periplaneta americana]|uniref:Uncharacterized protein n=1 Tax=Periplaneta americana TaxID=6978 RepID=A0ABQ8TBP3_PERAM|nr:hypothetical protein ANN_04750 [Periplaneta americana]